MDLDPRLLCVKTWHRLAVLCGASCLAACLATGATRSDPAAADEPVEVNGCREGSAPVQPSETLNGVARELSRGAKLNDAMHQLGYPALNAQSIHVTGPMNDAAIRAAIQERVCASAGKAPPDEVGVFRGGNETWIVLAARMDLPSPQDAAAVADRVLELVNAARAVPRTCGAARMNATRPLRLSPLLTRAAARHALDMGQHGKLDHRGSDDSVPAERVSQAGYRWRTVGENIAAGQSSAEAVVASWLESPGHCANIMGAQFTQMGVAFALAPSLDLHIYWAQVFAAPQ
jgi:uncharacterized protein YkwD